jgi:DNA-binding transcriptional LysR family regulator
VQIYDVRVFLAVVATGSLSAAGRQLGVGPMQISRRIAALEAQLQVRLFQRTTRSVSMTAEGEAFLLYATTMVDAADSAQQELRPSPTRVTGTLRMTAPSVFGQAIVMPLLPGLLEAHPELRIDLDLSDRVVDLVGQGLDLALRVATLADSDLIARRLAPNPRIICASPDYVSRYGQPATVAALASHVCVILQAVPKWPLIINGVLVRHQVQGRVVTSSVDAARAATLQGLGLAMLTYLDVHEHLRTGALVRIDLADAAMESLAVWAVTPSRLFAPTRVKVFLAELEKAFSRIAARC